MLRVVVLSTLPPERTGEAPYTANLLRALSAQKQVIVNAIGGTAAKPLSSQHDNILTLPIWRRNDRSYVLKLYRAISRLRPHLVHIQFGPYGRVFGGLFGEPMLLLLLLLRNSGIRTTITLHSTWMPDQVEERAKGYRFLGKLSILAKAAFQLYMRVLDLGTDTIQLSTVKLDSQLRRKFLQEYKIRSEKVLEIPHPCGTTAEQLEKSVALESLNLAEKTIILAFGFIRRSKALEIALDAVKLLKSSYPDLMLVIAGRPQTEADEVYLEELRKKAAEIQVRDRVRFDARFIPEEEAAEYFSAASAIVVPYSESVGVSAPIHNYAGFGVPVIASDSGYHIGEALGGNLLLFKAGNHLDLAQKIELVLRETELLVQIRDRQIEFVKGETWDLAGRRTVANYRCTMRL
jgi:glycosyltransferase involved in cell wall biosynthesis